MGTVKKAAKKKKADPAVQALAEGMGLIRESVDSVTDSFIDAMNELDEKGTVPQALLEAAEDLEKMQSVLKKTFEAFKTSALEVHEAGGSFEIGAMAITFPTTSKCSPSWKTEAVSLGRKVATLEEREFDEDRFCDKIKKQYPAKTSTTVKLIRSEG